MTNETQEQERKYSREEVKSVLDILSNGFHKIDVANSCYPGNEYQREFFAEAYQILDRIPSGVRTEYINQTLKGLEVYVRRKT